MENKAQMGISMMIIVFITAITGLVLFVSVAQTTGPLGDLTTVQNQSETAGANGATFYIEEYKHITDVVILNATSNTTIGAGNYTVANNQLHPTTGALTVAVTVDDAEFASVGWKVSGTAQKLDYIDSSGARSLADMIIVFFALAIAVVVMGPVVKEVGNFN